MLLFAGLAAGVVIAASVSLIVILSGNPSQTRNGPGSDAAQDAARRKAEHENEAARQAEAARLKAKQEKETQRLAEDARRKADKEKLATLKGQVPSWKTDFEEFVKVYQQHAAANFEDARRTLSGHSVRWSLTFKAVHPGDGQPYIEFDGLDRNLGGTEFITGPVAWFEPAPASLETWQAVSAGTRVTFTGRVDLSVPSVLDDPQTGQKAPGGAYLIDVSPTREGELSLSDVEELLKPALEMQHEGGLKIAQTRAARALSTARFSPPPAPEQTGPFKVAIKTGLLAKEDNRWHLQLELDPTGKQPDVDGFAIFFGVNEVLSMTALVEGLTASGDAKKQASMCEKGFHFTSSLVDTRTGAKIDSVSGVKGLKQSVPGAVSIPLEDPDLAQVLQINGPAPVIAQVYSLHQGKWEPQSEVFKADVRPETTSETAKEEEVAEWQKDYNAFLKIYPQAVISEEARALFHNRPVYWTLTFKKLKRLSQGPVLEFEGFDRPKGDIGLKLGQPFNAYAYFHPAADSQEQWKRIKTGSKVTIKGKIDVSVVSINEPVNIRTGEKTTVPGGAKVIDVVLDVETAAAPAETAPAPERDPPTSAPRKTRD